MSESPISLPVLINVPGLCLPGEAKLHYIYIVYKSSTYHISDFSFSVNSNTLHPSYDDSAKMSLTNKIHIQNNFHWICKYELVLVVFEW